MSTADSEILGHLATVDRLRLERAADAPLRDRVLAVKGYQSERFARSYADLLQDSRYRAATGFFLEELYGPQEFGARDAQFARVVPALVRLFPDDIVRTVAALAALHALSESLDTDMARRLATPTISAADYVQAWQSVGRPAEREQQIQWTLKIGRALDRYTRSPLLRTSLRMMRKPAQAAGLGDLQRFLETGFDTFGAMRRADEFLQTIELRERALLSALFTPEAVMQVSQQTTVHPTNSQWPLGQLP